MSGGKPTDHKKCMKSKKWDKHSEICKVCGYMVFRDMQQSKLFGDKGSDNNSYQKGGEKCRQN